MDVDLLRPGTVPISPETVLWFEFLLDEHLLLKHLLKPACGNYKSDVKFRKMHICNISDPSPIDLITIFFSAMLESLKNEIKPAIDVENGEQLVTGDNCVEVHFKSLKNLALKILSLKVAAHLKWNLSKYNSEYLVSNGLLIRYIFTQLMVINYKPLYKTFIINFCIL